MRGDKCERARDVQLHSVLQNEKPERYLRRHSGRRFGAALFEQACGVVHQTRWRGRPLTAPEPAFQALVVSGKSACVAQQQITEPQHAGEVLRQCGVDMVGPQDDLVRDALSERLEIHPAKWTGATRRQSQCFGDRYLCKRVAVTMQLLKLKRALVEGSAIARCCAA